MPIMAKRARISTTAELLFVTLGDLCWNQPNPYWQFVEQLAYRAVMIEAAAADTGDVM